jgi:hypothetical protein
MATQDQPSPPIEITISVYFMTEDPALAYRITEAMNRRWRCHCMTKARTEVRACLSVVWIALPLSALSLHVIFQLSDQLCRSRKWPRSVTPKDLAALIVRCFRPEGSDVVTPSDVLLWWLVCHGFLSLSMRRASRIMCIPLVALGPPLGT